MNAIKELRIKKNLTQAYLAEQLGVDKTTVSKWEIGTSSPRANMLPEIARILDCSIKDLYGNAIA